MLNQIKLQQGYLVHHDSEFIRFNETDSAIISQTHIHIEAGTSGYEFYANEGGYLQSFLSCLCGSEHVPENEQTEDTFLSCLCGSEHEISGNGT